MPEQDSGAPLLSIDSAPYALSQLEAFARKCRVDILRMTTRAQSGHPGGSLSAIDLLVALYGTQLRVSPAAPNNPHRDRFILSKGHASPSVYAVLAQAGFLSEDDLDRFRTLGGVCQGHVDVRCPGVDFSGGSLGMGLSFGVGCALAARLDGNDRTVTVMMGDGELQEGQLWEAAMSASHHKLGNLKGIVDLNGIQNDDFCYQQMDMGDIASKWSAFGWATRSLDGHNMEEIVEGLAWQHEQQNGPSVLLANTIKGKGVSFMENNPKYHGCAATPEELVVALEALG
ncbi:transketolase [bacterium]|nr:transketolase [bacterium]